MLVAGAMGTRKATVLGPESGAVHQAIRQFWIFTALFLDSFAVAGQSLVGYFMGSDRVEMAKRVAKTILQWSFGLGCALSLGMWVGETPLVAILVPESARNAFSAPWMVALIMQPINAMAFGTDGIHWGTSDFRFLRNATITATSVGITLLYGWALFFEQSILSIWIVTSIWIAIRVLFGMARIWPGYGNAPLKTPIN